MTLTLDPYHLLLFLVKFSRILFSAGYVPLSCLNLILASLEASRTHRRLMHWFVLLTSGLRQLRLQGPSSNPDLLIFRRSLILLIKVYLCVNLSFSTFHLYTLLNWCAAFLRNHQQHVKIGQEKSNWRSITAGVPQETKLGPLFFLVVINDLTTAAPSYKYIDDCTVFEMTSYSGATSDLQMHLDSINQWITDNNMRINTKTKD